MSRKNITIVFQFLGISHKTTVKRDLFTNNFIANMFHAFIFRRTMHNNPSLKRNLKDEMNTNKRI